MRTPKLGKHLELDRCPHCRVASPNLEKLWEAQTVKYDGTNMRFWRIYSCRRCGGLLTAAAPAWEAFVSEIFPSQPEADSAIPSRARDYLNQGMDSLQSPAGAVMLAASAVDEMLKQKGYKGGSLYPRIKKAEEDHLITAEMARWAHEVRLDANDQRHADEEVPLPDEKDAKKSLGFAIALAEFLFVLPSKITKGLKEAEVNEIPA